MGRIGYKKSRNGCMTCKKRRVKCDEKIPCTACTRHNVPCSLVPAAGHAPLPGVPTPRDKDEASSSGSGSSSCVSSSESPASLPRPRHHRPLHPATRPPVSDASNPAPAPAPEPAAFADMTGTDARILDLGLLHHYTSRTSQSFPLPPQSIWVFMDYIPRVALGHPHLLHQVLALAAVHAAYLRPGDRTKYLSHGSQHQGHAIAGMRRLLLAGADVATEEGSLALFLAAGLFLASSFASRHLYNADPGAAHTAMDEMLEIFTVVRGLRAIQEASARHIPGNVVYSLVSDRAPAEVSSGGTLDLVRDKLDELAVFISTCRHLDQEEARTVGEGIAALILSTGDIPGSKIMTSHELRAVFVWPRVLAQDFIALLEQRHPAALIVFLYYCIVLQATEDICWFLDGWSARLTRAIGKWLGDAPWADVSRWPLETLRLKGSRY